MQTLSNMKTSAKVEPKPLEEKLCEASLQNQPKMSEIAPGHPTSLVGAKSKLPTTLQWVAHRIGHCICSPLFPAVREVA